MMLCGEQYSVQVAAFMLQGLESNLYELFVTSESHLFGSGSGFGFGFGFGRVRVGLGLGSASRTKPLRRGIRR